MRTHFLTYGSAGFERNAHLLCDSATRCGFDKVECLDEKAIAGTEFALRNEAILLLKRGGGYWIWKAYIIRNRVNQLLDGEILLYSDAGRSGYYQFTRLPICILERTAKSEQGFLTGVSLSHLNPLAHWTKRDCLKLMGADTPEIYGKPVVQATWSIWTKTTAALDFLDAWLQYSEDPRCLTDAPNALGGENLSGFIDHRHDQSISSILTYQRSAPFLDFSGTLVQRLLDLRPRSELSHTFYKCAQNAEALLAGGSTPAILLREYLSLKNSR